MEGVGASVDQLLDEFRDLCSCSPFLGQALGLLEGWDLSSEEQPEETLWERLGSTWGGGELSLALGDGESSESDTLIGVKDGSFPDETLESAHVSRCVSRERFSEMDT